MTQPKVHNPNRILYNATCDQLSPTQWEVKVKGEPPYAYERTYLKAAATDDEAVRLSVADFIDEIECLPETAVN